MKYLFEFKLFGHICRNRGEMLASNSHHSEISDQWMSQLPRFDKNQVFQNQKKQNIFS